MGERSFFSVNYDLIVRNTVMPYDLYVNASALKDKQKYVRIFPQGEELSEEELNKYGWCMKAFKELYRVDAYN